MATTQELTIAHHTPASRGDSCRMAYHLNMATLPRISVSFCRYVLPLLFMLVPLALGASEPQLVPLQTTMEFSSDLGKNQAAALVPIKSTLGVTLYTISLEPDYSVGKHVTVLTVVLRRFGDKDATNLLDSPGIWHGIQLCDLAANDLAHGVQKSIFGETRTFRPKNLGVIVRITISKAVVSQISANEFQLDAVTLQIKVDKY